LSEKQPVQQVSYHWLGISPFLLITNKQSWLLKWYAFQQLAKATIFCSKSIPNRQNLRSVKTTRDLESFLVLRKPGYMLIHDTAVSTEPRQPGFFLSIVLCPHSVLQSSSSARA